jgi:hypothetical protein
MSEFSLDKIKTAYKADKELIKYFINKKKKELDVNEEYKIIFLDEKLYLKNIKNGVEKELNKNDYVALNIKNEVKVLSSILK